jgi:hypothetical protein
MGDLSGFDPGKSFSASDWGNLDVCQTGWPWWAIATTPYF